MQNDSSRNPSVLGLRDRLKFLAKDSAVYGGAAALSKAFALVTFPILARHFSVAEYGKIDFLTTISTLAAVAIIFGQDSAVARYFYEDEDTEARRELISQSLAFQLVVAVVGSLIVFLSAPWTLRPLLGDDSSQLAAFVFAASLPFRMFVSFTQNLLKWTFGRGRFLFISLGSVVVNALLLVAGVKFYGMGILGVLVVSLLSNIVFAFVGLYFVRAWVKLPRKTNHLRTLFLYAAPFGILGILSLFVPTMERTVIVKYLGTTELGHYAVATKMSLLAALAVGAFQTSWGPFSLSIHKQENASVTYNWVLLAFSSGMAILLLLISAIAKPLIMVLASEKYAAASIAVFPLTAALGIQAVGWISEIGTTIAKKSHLGLYGYAAYCAVTLGSVVLLTPPFGLLGTATGVMLGQLAKALISTWFSQKAYPLPWQFGTIGLISAGVFATGFGATMAESAGAQWWYSTSLYLVGCAWTILLCAKKLLPKKVITE